MKTITIFVFLLFVTVSPAVATHAATYLVAPAKVTGCFDYFRAHRQGSGITMTWASSSTNVVMYTIERSEDGEFFDPIGSMIAKGNGRNGTHKFKDDNVYPGVISYRIAALKSDGSTEYSPVETVRIVRHG